MRVIELSTFHETCGVATYTEALTAAMTELGADVSVLAPALRKGVQARGEQPRRLWAVSQASFADALRTYRAIKERSPDIVHAQINLGLYSARFLYTLVELCRRARIPFVATLHGRAGGSFGRRFALRRLLFALGHARLVVHNAAHRAELGRDGVDVIPHGVARPVLCELAQAKRALGLAAEQPVLAHFGFIEPDKGIEEVLRALPLVQKGRATRLSYRVIGGTFPNPASQAHLSKLRQLASELGVDASISGEFTSSERTLSELQAADWVVLNYHTGKSQGTSGAARHALSAGRPVAVSRAAIFDDLRTATLCLQEPLAKALCELLSSSSLTQDYELRARQFCDENAWDRIAARHLQLFERLLSS